MLMSHDITNVLISETALQHFLFFMLYEFQKCVRKFAHRQRLETRKSLEGLGILLARGEQHTNLLSAEFSSEWLPPFTFYSVSYHTHTYSLLLYSMCRDLGSIMSMQSSTYLGSVKIMIRVKITFLFSTPFSLSHLSSFWVLIYNGLSGIYAVIICRLFRQSESLKTPQIDSLVILKLELWLST